MVTSTGILGKGVDTLMKGQPVSTVEEQKYKLYKGLIKSGVANDDQKRFVNEYEMRSSGVNEAPTDTGGY